MHISLKLNNNSIVVDTPIKVKQLREMYGIPADHLVWALAVPPLKLYDTDEVRAGDLLVSGPKEKYPSA